MTYPFIMTGVRLSFCLYFHAMHTRYKTTLVGGKWVSVSKKHYSQALCLSKVCFSTQTNYSCWGFKLAGDYRFTVEHSRSHI